MDPDGSVWSLRTPWGLPGASWGPGGPRKGNKGGFTPRGLLGGLPISPSWANRPPINWTGSPMLKIGLQTYFLDFPVDD